MEEASRFEVTDHLELAGRGVFVVGHVRSGIFRIGMVVKSDTAEDILTISGIEYLDNLPEKRFWNALVFKEQPGLEELKKRFPAGTILEARQSPRC